MLPTDLPRQQRYECSPWSFLNLMSLLRTDPKRMVWSPRWQNRPGTLSNVQIPGQPPAPFCSRVPGVGPRNQPFTSFLTDSPLHSSLRTSGLKYGRYSRNVCRMSCHKWISRGAVETGVPSMESLSVLPGHGIGRRCLWATHWTLPGQHALSPRGLEWCSWWLLKLNFLWE